VTYLIRLDDGSVGMDHYYSPRIARLTGAAHGWSPEAREALRFDSEESAQLFAEKKLGQTPYQVVKHG